MFGVTPMVGNSDARLKRTMVRACRKRASAIFKSWLETVTCSSSAFNLGSPKISHQFPRRASELGWDLFHSSVSDSLYESGGGSLNAGVTGTGVFWYLGPTMQPASSPSRTRAEHTRRHRRRQLIALYPAWALCTPKFW